MSAIDRGPRGLSSKHAHGGFYDALLQNGVEARARHDAGLPIEDGGRALPNLPQLEEAERALFVVNEKIDLGAAPDVPSRICATSVRAPSGAQKT